MYGILSQVYLLGAFIVFVIILVSELAYREVSSAYETYGHKAISRVVLAIFFSWFTVIWTILRLKDKDWGR